MSKLTENVLLRGPWKVPLWGMFYKTLYLTAQPADFDAYINDLKITLREHGRFEALRALAFAPKTEAEERLEQVTAPTLVVMGTKDPDWPDPIAGSPHLFVEKMSAELVLIEGAGHYPKQKCRKRQRQPLFGLKWRELLICAL